MLYISSVFILYLSICSSFTTNYNDRDVVNATFRSSVRANACGNRIPADCALSGWSTDRSKKVTELQLLAVKAVD